LAAWLLLALYGALLTFLVYYGRHSFLQLKRSQWLGLALLIGAGFLASQLLPLALDGRLFRFGLRGEPATIALLSAVPYLLAGVAFGPAAALLVGVSTGFGHALGQTHQFGDPFTFALAAWVGAVLLRQRYQGRLYLLLRTPPVAGVLSGGAIVFLTGLTAFIVMPSGLLVRLDALLMVAGSVLLPLLLEGLVGGAILSLLFVALPDLRPASSLIPAPGQHSVRDYLATNVLLFGLATLLLASLFAFTVSVLWSTRLNVAQLAAAANASTVEMAELQVELENALEALGNEEQLIQNNKVSARALGQFQRTNQVFEAVLFVDLTATVLEAMPSSAATKPLSPTEQEALVKALAAHNGAAVIALHDDVLSGISIIVPMQGSEGSKRGALIGRVAAEKLRQVVGGFADDQRVMTAVLDGAGHTLFQSQGQPGAYGWSQAADPAMETVIVPAAFNGNAFLTDQGEDGRRLVYRGPTTAHSWHVAVSMPYADVLRQALAAALPLTLVLLALTGAFYVRTTAYGRGLAAPISELAQASRIIASGGNLPARLSVERQDEIGDLDRAFSDMHVAMKRRLDELSLLLTVSQEASASIDLDDNMPVILQGAIRGTGSTGARAVILNPSSGHPLTFTAGPAAAEMAILDRPLMSLIREQSEIHLHGPDELQAFQGLGDLQPLLLSGLYAVRLQAAGNFQGFLLLAFRQTRHPLAAGELALLRTLAGQASLLIEKSYLFTNAEGGRRRLAAVLASTSEAVIVTDQTARILLINRAFEKAFGIKAGQVIGRSIADVIPAPLLVDVLADPGSGRRNVEVEGRDRRIYFANASPIASHEGQVLGRVAVLHDITHLKEIDRVKSEFVDNVSHDLRTPLTVLSGYASALSMLDDLTPEQRDYSDHILKSVDRMVVLVENLLDLGRIEAGVDLVFEEIEVTGLLNSLADEHWLYAHESGVNLQLRPAAGLSPITADRVLLNQALSNLLTNAFKYAPHSGDLTLAAEQVAGEVIFSVRDRGPGIAGQDQIRLFEKFYRVRRHGAGRAKGSGLGLAIVLSIAERHQGRAWCESELGKGSTFYLAIPVAREG
jgi:PAS domain S-box-containing protein